MNMYINCTVVMVGGVSVGPMLVGWKYVFKITFKVFRPVWNAKLKPPNKVYTPVTVCEMACVLISMCPHKAVLLTAHGDYTHL